MEEMLNNNMLNEAGEHMLDRLVKEGEDPSMQMVQHGCEPVPISALLASQAISCNSFLDQVKAAGAMFENHVRHMGLPTQVSWLLAH